MPTASYWSVDDLLERPPCGGQPVAGSGSLPWGLLVDLRRRVVRAGRFLGAG